MVSSHPWIVLFAFNSSNLRMAITGTVNKNNRMNMVCPWQNHSDLWSLASPHRTGVRVKYLKHATKMHIVCKIFCVIATAITPITCQVYTWTFAAGTCWPGRVLLETVAFNHARRQNNADGKLGTNYLFKSLKNTRIAKDWQEYADLLRNLVVKKHK